MKKTDYLIFGGLVISLLMFLVLTSTNTTTQNLSILENQVLIKRGLNEAQNAAEEARNAAEEAQNATKIAKANSEIILDNQKTILEVANLTNELVEQHRERQDRGEQILDFLRTNFNESYLMREEFQYSQANESTKKLDTIVALLNKTAR